MGMIETKYIKVKVVGLVGGDQWIHKPEKGNGGLIHDPKMATKFTEQEAFEMRKKVIAQLPGTVKVTFDLKG